MTGDARPSRDAVVHDHAAQIEALARAVPSAVWSHGLDGTLLFSNDRWADLTGQRSVDTAHQGWAAVIDPDDLDRVRANWHRFEHGPLTGELRQTYRIVHARTGQRRTLKEHAVFAVPGDDRPITIVGSTYDITDEAENDAALRRNVAELEALVGTLPTVFWRFLPDGDVTYCSEQWRALTGRDPRSALGEGWRAAVVPEDLAGLTVAWDAFLGSEGPYRHEYRLQHADGRVRWALDIAAPVLDVDGAVAHYVGTTIDVTDQHEVEEQRHARASHHAALAALSQLALDPDVTTEGLLAFADRCLRRAVVTTPMTVSTAPPDRYEPTGAPMFTIVADGATIGTIEPSDPSARLNADDVAFLDTMARILGVAAERGRADRDARFQAAHDGLTGLPNRGQLLGTLAETIEAARHDTAAFAVLFCDLDNFKIYNDSMGHAAGDRVLTAAADRLATLVRPTDTLARLGSDEFVILCTGLRRSDDALEVAERIADAFRTPLTVGSDDLHMSVTIGVATPENSTLDASALLRDADAAMYAAKRLGRGRVAAFSAQMRLDAVERLTLEGSLRRALDEGALQCHYQPIVALADGSLKAFEALLRWNHPTRGPVAPSTFIPIAEETGLIIPIGTWVIGEACAQAARWNAIAPDARPTTVSVNLSAWQIIDPDLCSIITRGCAEWGIAPGQLAVEITESVLLSDVEAAIRTLATLRDLGVQVWLDDFGTGYSSLAYVRRLPLTALKLDRSFIASIESDLRDREIVRAVTAMARALELPVIAEGIERAEPGAILQALGCDQGQGYHYARPLAAIDADGFVARLAGPRPSSQ
jgi:diguanylate cyclase (GGDEF)-like protein/PAS domain S-box-containing protein